MILIDNQIIEPKKVR